MRHEITPCQFRGLRKIIESAKLRSDIISISHTRTVSDRRVDRGPQQVFFCDFINYFRDISPAIEDDEYFNEVALNSWVFPVKGDQGESNYGNSGDSTCRALVTHPDGYQEVNK